MEMTHESGRQTSSTSTWWSSSTNDFEVFNLFLEEVRSIVNDISIEKQPQEFNWRLRSILLNRRHIDVINENKSMLISFGS